MIFVPTPDGFEWFDHDGELCARLSPIEVYALSQLRTDLQSALREHSAVTARDLTDAGIVRNRRKIDATITNARATVELRADGGLAELVWSFRPAETPAPSTYAEVPTTSPESVALSKELKRRGFTFVGPTTMFALMEAVGIVDTHLLGSHRRGSSGVWP